MGQAKNWTKEELEYLQDKWGVFSISGIAKTLNRSLSGVKQKACRLGLGAVLESGDYVTFNQLYAAFTGYSKTTTGYAVVSWVKNRGLPVHFKRVDKCHFRVVKLEEFWEWAWKNRSFLDFSKMEKYSLGAEPPWVDEQRRRDRQTANERLSSPWTPEEDSRLKMLLRQQKYGYQELSELLHRSCGAIQRRCLDLGIKDRPLKADIHGKPWTQADYELLEDGIRQGFSYTQIAARLGRSDKAVRGKVFDTYLTEVPDKVRSMMGSMPWGYGAPEPTVRQALLLTRTRSKTRQALANLCGVLQAQVNACREDTAEYFQRATCTHWDSLRHHCQQGDNCDTCPHFSRKEIL